jgi:hypothetical protein
VLLEVIHWCKSETPLADACDERSNVNLQALSWTCKRLWSLVNDIYSSEGSYQLAGTSTLKYSHPDNQSIITPKDITFLSGSDRKNGGLCAAFEMDANGKQDCSQAVCPGKA